MLESGWRSMKSYLHNYIENNKSKIFSDTINEFKKQISISINNIQEYIIGTILMKLNENIESDYACFWEINKQSNILLERKNNFIIFINEITSKLNLIQEKLNEQLPKKEKNNSVKEKEKR
jgi:hypothetical protein